MARWSPIASATSTPAYGRVRQRRPEARADRFARALDHVRRAVHHARRAARGRRAAHVAGRAEAALEQPDLVVEAVRIGSAVRTLQAHRELPALAGAHRQRRPGTLARAGRVPGQRDARGTATPRAATCSTSKSKRTPRSNGCGRLATTPVTTTSRPSQRGIDAVGQAHLRESPPPTRIRSSAAATGHPRRRANAIARRPPAARPSERRPRSRATAAARLQLQQRGTGGERDESHPHLECTHCREGP